MMRLKIQLKILRNPLNNKTLINIQKIINDYIYCILKN